MTKITGKYYTDANFINVCTDNTLYTIARNTGDWGCRKVGDKPDSVCSTAKHIRQSWNNAPKQAHSH